MLQAKSWLDEKWDSLEKAIETAVSSKFQELASAQAPKGAPVTQAAAATKAPAATQAPAAASAAATRPSAPAPVSKTAATRPSKPVPAVQSSSELPSKKHKKYGWKNAAGFAKQPILSPDTVRVVGLQNDVSVFQSSANTMIGRKTLIRRVP